MRASNSACGYANSCPLLPMDKSSTSHSPMPCGAGYEDETRKAAECPLLALSGHHDRGDLCPLLGAKRTSGNRGLRIETVGCAVALTVAVDCVGAVGLNARRRINRIFVPARHSLEPSALLDRQRSMENIALNDSGAI